MPDFNNLPPGDALKMIVGAMGALFFFGVLAVLKLREWCSRRGHWEQR